MKKRFKGILGLLLVVVMTVSILSGCNSKNSNEKASDSTSQEQKKESVSKTEKKEEQKKDSVSKTDNKEEQVAVDILSGTITEGVEGELEQAMADAYMEQNPNVTINFIGTPANEVTKKMMAYVAADDLPEAFVLFQDFLPQAIELGIIEDLKPHLSKEYYDGFLEGPLKDVTVDGKMVRFPWFIVPSAVIYRTDWLEEAGLDVPDTWEDFLEVAKAMTKDTDSDGRIDRWGFSMVGTNNGSGQSRFFNLARNFGCQDATLVDGKWSTTVTTPEFKEALKFFTDLYTVHKVVPPGPTETGYTEAVNYLANEQTGMMITGSNGMGLLLTKNPDLDGKLGSFLIPEKGDAVGAQAGAVGYSVSSAAEEKGKEVIIDYLKFMNEPKYAIEFAQKTGRMPVRVESTSAEIFNEPTYKGFVQALDKVYFPENFPMTKQLWDSIGLAYTEIMANGVSIDDAVEELIEKNEDFLKEANQQ